MVIGCEPSYSRLATSIGFGLHVIELQCEVLRRLMRPRNILQRLVEDHAVRQRRLQFGRTSGADLSAEESQDSQLLHCFELRQRIVRQRDPLQFE